MTLSTSERKLQQGFRYLNRFMVLMFRLGLGWLINLWPAVGGRILVIRHIGRKSSLPHFSPVNYAVVDGEIYCAAGFGAVSDWYKNLMAHPEAEIWLPDSWYEARVEDISDDPKRLELLRAVLIGAGVASFAAGIDPYTISDAELAQKTGAYRLLHVRRGLARTGPEGPGDMAWVWPVLTFVLLMRRSRRRRR